MEPLHEFMQRWTHREYLTRLSWLDEQWNRPNRSDNYLMQIAAEVRYFLAKTRPKTLKEFILSFSREGEKKKPKGPPSKQGIQASKMGWLAHMGAKVVRKWRPKPK